MSAAYMSFNAARAPTAALSLSATYRDEPYLLAYLIGGVVG